MKNILVTGAGGYIGSHFCRFAMLNGYQVSALDNFSNGYVDAVSAKEIFDCDLLDKISIKNILKSRQFNHIVHFAGVIDVAESAVNPIKYYENNALATYNLFSEAGAAGITSYVLSSTAAVYGIHPSGLIPETSELAPLSPYGRSKLAAELIASDIARALNLKCCIFRYFNASGAWPSERLGERHEPETHLIPIILQASTGRRRGVSIHGNDYDTLDGTAVRDYVHVLDICEAHLLALEAEFSINDRVQVFNLGSGTGYSVQQIVDACKAVTGNDFSVTQSPRRPGDPATLVADITKAKDMLTWSPIRSSLENIIQDAYEWELINFCN